MKGSTGRLCPAEHHCVKKEKKPLFQSPGPGSPGVCFALGPREVVDLWAQADSALPEKLAEMQVH